MIEGTLTVNLDPPYLGFRVEAEDKIYSRSCSREDIREILTEFGGLNWPLKDCVIRMPARFSKDAIRGLFS
jgi:hypothetical protein